MNTTSQTITPQQHLTVVKHLATGKNLDVVATITHLDRSQVLDIGSKHGYPDTEKLTWAVDILVKKLEAADEIPQHPDAAAIARSGQTTRPSIQQQPTSRPAGVASTPAPTGHPTAPKPTPAAAPAPAEAKVDAAEALLAEASESKSKAVQRLGEKIRDLLVDLDERLDAQKRKEAAQARREQERADAKAEVARLQRQLEAAKQRLRSPAKKAREQAVKNGEQRTSQATGDYPCTVDGCDRTFSTPQGASLHERRVHGDLTGNLAAGDAA